MKKVFLSTALILALSLSFVSCKKAADKAADAAEATEEVAEEAVAEVAEKVEEVAEKVEEKVEEVASGVPSFDDAKVQEYVNSYEAYVAEYAKAAESKDMTAFAALGTKGQELAKQSQEALTGLSADDAKKLTDYMTEKSKTLQELATKMTAQ